MKQSRHRLDAYWLWNRHSFWKRSKDLSVSSRPVFLLDRKSARSHRSRGYASPVCRYPFCRWSNDGQGHRLCLHKCNHVGGRQELQSSIQQRCEAPHSRERGRNLQMELRKASLLNEGLMLPAPGNFPDLMGISISNAASSRLPPSSPKNAVWPSPVPELELLKSAPTILLGIDRNLCLISMQYQG